MQTKTAAPLLVIALAASHLLAKDEEHPMEHPTSYRTIQVDGLSIFYREAGPTDVEVLARIRRMRPSLTFSISLIIAANLSAAADANR